MSVSYDEPSAPKWERFDRDRSAERSGLLLGIYALFEFFPQRRHDTVGRFYVPDREPVREVVDPGDLKAHGGVERPPSLVGENDKLRPAMMRVGLECDEAFLLQVVDDPLHVLAIGPQVARKPRDRLRAFASDDGPEDLPTGARQPEPRNQPIACGQNQAVEPENVEDEVGQGIAGRRSLGLVHFRHNTLLTSSCQYNMSLSY